MGKQRNKRNNFYITMNDFNPHSRLASFYRYFYLVTDLPNNLCTYFWKLLFAFIWFPLVWPAMLINYLNKKIVLEYNTHNEYDKNWRILSTEKRCRYLKRHNALENGNGALLTLLILFIGVFTCYYITFNCSAIFFNIDIFKSIGVICGALIIYGTGLLVVFTAIAYFVIGIDIVRLFSKVKKVLTQEELDALQAKKDAEHEAMCERDRYRAANPNFIILTWRWIVAFKERNCPLITWEYNKFNNKNK